MLSLVIVFGALFVVIDSLCAYLDARVALWGCLAGLADRAHHHTARAQHYAATRFGRAVRRRYP